MPRRVTWFKCLLLAGLFVNAGSQAHGQAKDPSNQIGLEAVQAVKQATVHLKVTLGGKQEAEESGFFAVEPGLTSPTRT